jgi:hypothetical protein
MSYTVTLPCGCDVYVSCHPLSGIAHTRVLERRDAHCRIRNHQVGARVWLWQLLPNTSEAALDGPGGMKAAVSRDRHEFNPTDTRASRDRDASMGLWTCRPVAGGRMSSRVGRKPRTDVPLGKLRHSLPDHRAPAGLVEVRTLDRNLGKACGAGGPPSGPPSGVLLPSSGSSPVRPFDVPKSDRRSHVGVPRPEAICSRPTPRAGE